MSSRCCHTYMPVCFCTAFAYLPVSFCTAFWLYASLSWYSFLPICQSFFVQEARGAADAATHAPLSLCTACSGTGGLLLQCTCCGLSSLHAAAVASRRVCCDAVWGTFLAPPVQRPYLLRHVLVCLICKQVRLCHMQHAEAHSVGLPQRQPQPDTRDSNRQRRHARHTLLRSRRGAPQLQQQAQGLLC